MSKQILEKCLKDKPQSEKQNVDFVTLSSQHYNLDSCFSEEVTGKVNHSKTSVNLTIGTNKNSDIWSWG